MRMAAWPLSMSADLMREFVQWFHVRNGLKGIEGRNPVLVYQMGKVGSSTVTQALARIEGLGPVIQLHTLSESGVARAIAKTRASGRRRLDRHLLVSKALSKRAPFPCRIITMTREPIARAISLVFQDRQRRMPEAIRSDGTVDPLLAERAVSGLLASGVGLADPTGWFDNELRDVFGIDVFFH